MTDNEIMICAAEDDLEKIWWDVNTGAIIFKNDDKSQNVPRLVLQGCRGK